VKTPVDLAAIDGYTAHRRLKLLGENPHPARTAARRAWRAGWLEREESFTRTTRLDARRAAGVL
jgi:hypothetical protein